MTDQKLPFSPQEKRRREEMYQLAQWGRCTIMLEETAATLLSRCLPWWCTGNTKKLRGSATDPTLTGLFFFYILSSSAGDILWLSSDSEQRTTEDLLIASLSLKYGCMAVCSNRCSVICLNASWCLTHSAFHYLVHHPSQAWTKTRLCTPTSCCWAVHETWVNSR